MLIMSLSYTNYNFSILIIILIIKLLLYLKVFEKVLRYIQGFQINFEIIYLIMIYKMMLSLNQMSFIYLLLHLCAHINLLDSLMFTIIINLYNFT
jgi:hypothetical protein